MLIGLMAPLAFLLKTINRQYDFQKRQPHLTPLALLGVRTVVSLGPKPNTLRALLPASVPSLVGVEAACKHTDRPGPSPKPQALIPRVPVSPASEALTLSDFRSFAC